MKPHGLAHCPHHIQPDNGHKTSEDVSEIMETDTYIIPFSPNQDARQAKNILSDHSTKMMIFLNSRSTICLGGLKHRVNMEFRMNNLIPLRKIIWTVRGFTFISQNWLLVKFVIQGKTTKQALYICKISSGFISAKQPELM